MSLKPAKYATVIGRSDKEQGPRLVNSPLVNTIIRVHILGVSRPLLIQCSAVRDRSDIARSKLGITINKLIS